LNIVPSNPYKTFFLSPRKLAGTASDKLVESYKLSDNLFMEPSQEILEEKEPSLFSGELIVLGTASAKPTPYRNGTC
jgi:hypothetical protein